MCLDIHFRIEHDEFLVQALLIRTKEMIFLEVQFQRVVVDKVLLLPAFIATIADMAPLVLLPAMYVQLIIPIEPLSTESAFWVSLESTLIDSPWVIVTELLMLP
jgi:hypothetical protein